eukprot:PhM_4_TR16714/c0_g1_i1/m.7986/K06176/truD, PUS7; tRNA pseudouridine13 synthase
MSVPSKFFIDQKFFITETLSYKSTLEDNEAIDGLYRTVGGQLKRSPEDFRVEEIDPYNEVVTLEHYIGRQEDNKVDVITRKKIDAPPKRGREEFSLSSLRDRLAEQLGEDKVDGVLQSMSEQRGQESLDASWNVSIGSFPDKHERGFIRVAVLFNFPWLTTTYSKDKNHSVDVTHNESYFNVFRVALADAAQADELVRFSLLDVPSTTVGGDGRLRISYAPNIEKEVKTLFRQRVAKVYAQLIVDVVDGQLSVKRRHHGGAAGEQAPPPADRYVEFVMHKRMLESFEATHVLEQRLPPSCRGTITMAGIKDKVGITTQRICIRSPRGDVDRLLRSLAPPDGSDFPVKFHVRDNDDMEVEGDNASYLVLAHPQSIVNVTRPLQTGELGGNRFTIVVRDWTVAKNNDNSSTTGDIAEVVMDWIKRRVEHHWAKDGFINYFGEQRFGNEHWNPIAYDIMLGHFAQAYDKISHTPTAKRACQKVFGRRGATPTTEAECQNVLLALPYSERTLFFHSFQALAWNYVASEMVSKIAENKNKILSSEEELTLLAAETTPNTNDAHIPSQYQPFLEKFFPLVSVQHLQKEHLGVRMKPVARRLCQQPAEVSCKSVVVLDGNRGDDNLQTIRADVTVQFSLPPSTYATMAIRQLLS